MFEINPNQSPVDMYTLFHVAVGSFSRMAGLSFETTIAMSLAFEWWIEPMYKEKYPGIFPVPSQDTPINSAVDTAAVALGWKMFK